MGWSASALAINVHEALNDVLQRGGSDDRNSANVWVRENRHYFWETGRENDDGAVTGTVMGQWQNDPSRYIKVGSFRIEATGKITRFPTSTAAERREAEETGKKKFAAVYGEAELRNQIDIAEGR
jgi:hypothetical protein